MSIQEDVARARSAARDLATAVDRLRRSQPDTVDLRRLAEDVGRVQADLDLLTGSSPQAAGRTTAVDPRTDTQYDPRQFVDGADEDFTSRRR
jgi:hypothetical protein